MPEATTKKTSRKLPASSKPTTRTTTAKATAKAPGGTTSNATSGPARNADQAPAPTPQGSGQSAPAAAQGARVPKDINPADKYYKTGKYNPKAKKNVDSWEAVIAILPATYREIVEALPQHTDFVGYLIRRKALTTDPDA